MTREWRINYEGPTQSDRSDSLEVMMGLFKKHVIPGGPVETPEDITVRFGIRGVDPPAWVDTNTPVILPRGDSKMVNYLVSSKGADSLYVLVAHNNDFTLLTIGSYRYLIRHESP